VLLSAERAARSTAEEALSLVEAILTSAPVGIAVFDLDLRYVRVNDAYAGLSGVPAADHVGGRLGDVVPLQADVAADPCRGARPPGSCSNAPPRRVSKRRSGHILGRWPVGGRKG